MRTLLVPFLSVVAAGLVACGGDETTTATTGTETTTTTTATTPTTTTPTTTTPTESYFDVWGFAFQEGYFHYDGQEMGSAFLTAGDPNSEIPPYMVLRFYNSDWQVTFDLSDACDIEVMVDTIGLNDFGLGSDAWVGWDVMFTPTDTDLSQLVPDYYAPRCDNFDPLLWGDETGDAFVSYYTWGLAYGIDPGDGINPPLNDSVKDFVDSAAGAYGDWDTDWAPYLYDTWIAIDGGNAGLWALNVGFTYQTDADAVVQSSGQDMGFPHYDWLPVSYAGGPGGARMPNGLHSEFGWYLLTFGY